MSRLAILSLCHLIMDRLIKVIKKRCEPLTFPIALRYLATARCISSATVNSPLPHGTTTRTWSKLTVTFRAGNWTDDIISVLLIPQSFLRPVKANNKLLNVAETAIQYGKQYLKLTKWLPKRRADSRQRFKSAFFYLFKYSDRSLSDNHC